MALNGVATIRRYLAREIYKATAFVLVAFLVLFAFFDLIGELRDVGRAGYQLAEAFAFVALSLPGHVYELFPIAVLIGTLYVLAHLASNSEFTVMRTSGLSPAQAGITLARTGLVFSLLILLTGELVTPVAERMAQRLRLMSMGSVVGTEFRTGIWVRSEGSYVNVARVTPDGAVHGVRLYQFDDDKRLLSISDAKEGRYTGKGVWMLSGIVETHFSPQGATVDHKAEMPWKSVLTPDVITVLTVDPQKMSAWDLFDYTQHLSANKQNVVRYEIALWQKLAYPVAALVMMALALPFGYLHVRHGGLGVKVFSGIMLGVMFDGLNTLFSNLGILQNWPPAVSAWIPSTLFLLTAIVMMWWVERR
jgi:lipopolysaccharide export system permease protein